jgi:MFS family permease
MAGLSAIILRPISRRNLVRFPLITAAVASIVGAIGVLLLSTGTATIWIVVITLIFGVTLGTFASSNQTALYTQAHAQQIGTAAGLLRTSIASSAIISIVFHSSVTDHGLHTIAVIMIAVSVVGLVLALADRSLRAPKSEP